MPCELVDTRPTMIDIAGDQHAPSPAVNRVLRIMFVATTLPVGGAETLLLNLIRGLDRQRFAPELCCLKSLGPIGETLAAEIPVTERQLQSKFDVRVIGRLARLMKSRAIDAVVTVGTGGDKMFWGRLAAWRAGVPVVISALHSTGLPDRVERANRLLSPWTDAFVALANSHAAYLAAHEGCPPAKIRVVRNGVDTRRFRPLPPSEALRAELRIPVGAPVATIVAALRPEKNHELFLRAAARVARRVPEAHFLIVGDGPQRPGLEAISRDLGLETVVRFAGTRGDVPEILALSDVFVLSSKMEASPVSILEAMACGKPIVAPRVGSIHESVVDGRHGWLVPPDDVEALAARVERLLIDRAAAAEMGVRARKEVLAKGSLDVMVGGYQDLITQLFVAKRGSSD